MPRLATYALVIVSALLLSLFAYGAKGYLDASLDADALRDRADRLIDQGLDGNSLGSARLDALLQVQDPAFRDHGGVDFTTPGAGATTISQSLSKRLAFETFRPGLAKIRQTGYALGLEQTLSKDQILALWLDTLEMGNGPSGWMTGFHRASQTLHGRDPADLAHREFLQLVAVLIAPSTFDLTTPDPQLETRVARIQRLLAGQCAPLDHGDVWLEGCRSTSR
jgi:membrane carboxypeptidase/penicillin-binding protein PbpC